MNLKFLLATVLLLFGLQLVPIAYSCLFFQAEYYIHVDKGVKENWIYANLVDNKVETCHLDAPGRYLDANGKHPFTCYAKGYAATFDDSSKYGDNLGEVSYARPGATFTFLATGGYPCFEPHTNCSTGAWKACEYGCSGDQCPGMETVP